MRGKKRTLIVGLVLMGLIYAGISWAATAPTAIYLGVVGEKLGKPGQAAVDYKNNLYVTYPQDHVVRIFSPAGQLIKTLDKASDGSNLFVSPGSVAADLTGKIFVGDKNRVVVLDMNDSNYLKYLGAGAGEFLSVQALAVYNPYNPAGDPAYMQTPLILVADCYGGYGYIKGYSLVGNDYVKVPVYDSNADTIPDSDYPLPVVDKYNSFVGYAGVLATGMAVDNVGKRLLVTDKLNFNLNEYDLKTFALTPVVTHNFGGSGFQNIGRIADLAGAAADTAGRLYFALGYNSYILVTDRGTNNTKLCTIGTPGSAVGQILQPSGVLVDFQKRLVVSDTENSRLVLYQLDAGPPVPYSAPDRPVLVSPLNTVTTDTQPALTIANLYEYNGNPVNYTVEISAAQDFSPLAKTFNSPTPVPPGTTTATITAADWGSSTLAPSTQYWWRAKAVNSAVATLASDWSDVGTFYVKDGAVNLPPAAPQLKSPNHNDIVGMETLLEWYPAADPYVFGAVTYTVEIFDNSRRPLLVATQAGISNCWIKIDELAGYNSIRERRSYSWQVKAASDFGTSLPSSKRSFRLVRSGVRIKALPGTVVYTDGNDAYLGQYQGLVPAGGYFTAELEPGRHVVRLQKAGYNPYYASVKVFSKTLTAVAAVQKLVAQPLTASTLSVPQAVTLPADYHPVGARPVVVDWNGDGTKELLVGESNGNLTLFSPSGAASPGFQSPVLLTNIGSAAAPFVIDWHSNGNKNILVGDGSGKVRFYFSKEALGADNYTELTNADGSPLIVPAGPAVPWVVDWNNDQKKDLLVGAGDGYVYLFLNTGTDNNPQLTPQGRIKFADNTDLIVDNLKNAAPLTVYWDKDGKMDLLVGYSNGQVHVFKNISTTDNPAFDNNVISTLLDPDGNPFRNYLGAGASPFVVFWQWGTDTVMDLLLGSDQNGLWATRLNDLQ